MFATELLFDPDSFFGETDVGIGFPAAVLVGMGVCSLLAAGLRLWVVIQSVDGPGTQTALALVGLVSLVVSVFVPFVTCLAYGAAIYALARFYGGSGSFRTTFWAVGYGFLPGLLGSVVVVAATALAVSAVPPPASPDQIGAFMSRVDAHTASHLGEAVNLATLAWSGFLWAFAMKHVHEVDELDGVVAVGAPLVVALTLRILGIV